MADLALVKRWKISETLLMSAQRALPRPEKKEEDQFSALEKEFLGYIEHNEHELALDMLQELGELTEPRGGFWRDLVRAAGNMGLHERIAYFEKKYEEALSRLKRK